MANRDRRLPGKDLRFTVVPENMCPLVWETPHTFCSVTLGRGPEKAEAISDKSLKWQSRALSCTGSTGCSPRPFPVPLSFALFSLSSERDPEHAALS